MRVDAIRLAGCWNSQTFGRMIGGEGFPEKVIQEAGKLRRVGGTRGVWKIIG